MTPPIYQIELLVLYNKLNILSTYCGR